MNWKEISEKIKAGKVYMLELDHGLHELKNYKKETNPKEYNNVLKKYECYTDSKNFYKERYNLGTIYAVNCFMDAYNKYQNSISSYTAFCLKEKEITDCCIIRGLKYFTEESYKADEIGKNKKHISYSFLDEKLEEKYYNKKDREKVMEIKL